MTLDLHSFYLGRTRVMQTDGHSQGKLSQSFEVFWGGVKTERVFPGLSVLRKNKKMEVLYPEN